MTVFNAEPATLDFLLQPANRAITFTFNNGALNVSGVWEFAIRDAYIDDSIRLSPTVNTTQAAVGIVVVSFTEAQLLGLIDSVNDVYEGVYTMEKDTVPMFAGEFRVTQKATRA